MGCARRTPPIPSAAATFYPPECRAIDITRAGGGSNEQARPLDLVARRRTCLATPGCSSEEGDAGDRLPRQRLARPGCTECGRVPPGTERNRLRRGTKRGDRIPLGGGPL